MPSDVEIAELIAFATIVDAKSLSRAAAVLGQPRATLGRRLARLEKNLGVRLLRRTTRSLALTDAGQAFYRHARIAIDAVDSAIASVQESSDTLRGDVRVSMPPGPLEGFEKMVGAFMRKHPHVNLHIDRSTRMVDLDRDGYDFALRASISLPPGLIARTVGRTPSIAVASPAYIERYGEPVKVADLARHRCLQGFARGEMPQTTWPLANGRRINVAGVFSSNDLRTLHGLVLAGEGIAFLPVILVGADLHRGKLVHVLAGKIEERHRLAIVYRERELMPPPVRAFIEAMSDWAREQMQLAAETAGCAKRPALSARA